jgi:hypothetical protein
MGTGHTQDRIPACAFFFRGWTMETEVWGANLVGLQMAGVGGLWAVVGVWGARTAAVGP